MVLHAATCRATCTTTLGPTVKAALYAATACHLKRVLPEKLSLRSMQQESSVGDARVTSTIELGGPTSPDVQPSAVWLDSSHVAVSRCGVLPMARPSRRDTVCGLIFLGRSAMQSLIASDVESRLSDELGDSC